MQNVFAWLSIGSGLVAAGLWLWACKAKVLYVPEIDADGFTAASLTVMKPNGERVDPIKTADQGNTRNAYAAIATAIAVVFQAVAQALPAACACLPNVPTH